MQFNRQASLHELEKELVGCRLDQHHRGVAQRVRCGKMIDTQREQTIICCHGVRLSTSKPAHGRCRSPSAARFGSRSQLAPRRSSAAGSTSMVENFVYSFVWVLVGRVRLPGPKM